MKQQSKQATLISAPQQTALTKALSLKGEIVAYHQAATKAAEDAMENLFQCGRLLEDVKAVLKADKTTTFGKWCEQFCGFSEPSAHSYCRLHNGLRDLTKTQRAKVFQDHQSQRAVAAFLTDQRKSADPDPVTVKPKPKSTGIEPISQTEGYMAVIRNEPTDQQLPYDPDADDIDITEPTNAEIMGTEGPEPDLSENLDAEPPPADEPPAKAVKNGAEKVSAAKLVDEVIRTLVSPLAKALLNIAKANGGKGEQYELATDHLNEVLTSLKEMKGGKR